MDKYEVIGSLGEGSFGRVYKAKQLCNGDFVALKVISKRGRSGKEIKDLRGECEIQRRLNHPNIIQMLDSFETENEIVVITEFAHKELNVILGKEGYLCEERVRAIVWDLVSALYYLHSHRVLHRDLKPQNILLDAKNKAKLCDFGFARNMSTGTHVLTSIKGTPLYMAPELIDELPYDHNADLWSLGCIIYELLVGAPPFCTASILHLIRLIRHEQVQWPTFLSDDCISFLKGLLQKDPKRRFSWPQILNHSFVKGRILISENNHDMPLTRPLSTNTMQLKDQQRKEHVNQKNHQQKSVFAKTTEPEQKNSTNSKTSKGSQGSNPNASMFPNPSLSVNQDIENNNPPLAERMNRLSLDQNKSTDKTASTPVKPVAAPADTFLKRNSTETSGNSDKEPSGKSITVIAESLKFMEESHPIETEEWIVFLQRSIEEIMNGETASLTQPNLMNVLLSPLRNSNTSAKVLTHVAKLFSIPFVVRGTSKDTVAQIKKVYLEVKLVPNLVYASKLLLRQKSASSAESSGNSPIFTGDYKHKSFNEISDDELDGLEYIHLLISHLVFLDEDFLVQFCDAVVVLNVYGLFHTMMNLAKHRLRIVLDLVAILTHILRKFSEHCEIVEKILMNSSGNEKESLNFVNLLRHEDLLLRERTCYLFLFLARCSSKMLVNVWNENIKETIEALMYDSMATVRNAAEKCVEELKNKDFY